MNNKFSGQCQCGEIRYEVSGVSKSLFVCHCTECQRQSSSAFGMALWIQNPQLGLTRGRLKKWVRRTPSGKDMECSFCPNCGTRLFHQIIGQDNVLSIKPGTLDDTSWLEPVGHIWTNKAQPWIQLGHKTLQYDKNPHSFAEMCTAWEKMHSPKNGE